jgi:hypothetical protein
VVLGLSPHDAFGNPTALDPQSLQVEVFPPCNCLVTYSSGSGNLLLRCVTGMGGRGETRVARVGVCRHDSHHTCCRY